MDIAALIISIIAALMSGFLLIDFLAQKKSSHIIQYVDPMTMRAPVQEADAMQQQDFTEFDMTDPATMAINEMKRRT